MCPCPSVFLVPQDHKYLQQCLATCRASRSSVRHLYTRVDEALTLTGEEVVIMGPCLSTSGMSFAAWHLVDEVGLATITMMLYIAVATAPASELSSMSL